MSLKLRLSLFFSLFLAAILAMVAIALYSTTKQSLKASMVERAKLAITDLKSEQLKTASNRMPGNAYFEMVIYPRGVVPLRNADDIPNGIQITILGRSNPTQDSLLAKLSPEDRQALFENDEIRTDIVLDSGETLRVVGEAGQMWISRFDGDAPGYYFVAYSPFTFQPTLAQLRRNLFWVIIPSFLLFLLGIWLLANQILLPLKRITSAAEKVTSQDLSQRLPVPNSRDEVSTLANTVNQMLDRLQNSVVTQRRFTADASHELRTPVTAISGHASYLLRRTNPTGQQEDSLTVIKEESDRMTKLVNDLLELARVDGGVFPINRDPLNFVDVLEDVKRDVEPIATMANITMSSPKPIIEVLGDTARLKQVVLNLVQNALNAGSSQVAMNLNELKEENADGIITDYVELQVLDNGPGIPQEALDNIFDRFFRVDGARSTRGNGTGLGLAIVKEIVQRHDGIISVTSEIGEGTVFTVRIPANNDPELTEMIMPVRKSQVESNILTT